MTPGARVAAAMEILDTIGTGLAAEPALTRWARGHRFAGSGDRAAIRDHVFDVLRCKRSCAWLGGGDTGRQLMIGWARRFDAPLDELFSGIGHAPPVLADSEILSPDLEESPPGVRLDCPDDLLPIFQQDHGQDADAILAALQHRAPVFLRVNLAKSTLSEVQEVLVRDGIETRGHLLSASTLEITANPRRLRNNTAYTDGLVELQDAASQAAVDLLPLKSDSRVLDFCAGGGGKSLAMVGRGVKTVFAHDSDPARMIDLPVRAERAGADIQAIAGEDLKELKFDLVLCDAPCSGSGAWRRSPAAKWDLDVEKLKDYANVQIKILSQASVFVGENGYIAYMTCSVFDQENHGPIIEFLEDNPNFERHSEKQFTPLDGGDGFFVALLQRTRPP